MKESIKWTCPLFFAEPLLLADGSTSRVRLVGKRRGTEAAYNLEVAGEHVYYVSKTGVLVHNAYPRKYVPGYGWKDARWRRMVRQVRSGEELSVKSLRIAAELRRDAFPNFARSRYRGPLKKMPPLEGTYDWHVHGGVHSTPHIQIKDLEGNWIRSFVE